MTEKKQKGRKPKPESAKIKQKQVYITDATNTELEGYYGSLTKALEPAIEKLPAAARKRIKIN